MSAIDHARTIIDNVTSSDGKYLDDDVDPGAAATAYALLALYELLEQRLPGAPRLKSVVNSHTSTWQRATEVDEERAAAVELAAGLLPGDHNQAIMRDLAQRMREGLA